MVLYGDKMWQLQVPTVMLAAIGLAVPACVRLRSYWLLLAGLQLALIVPRSYTVDNHKLLLFYWTTALAVGVSNIQALRMSARLLIGLCFLFAASWKIVTGEYWDGSFLHTTLLTDPRFRPFTHWVTGLTPGALLENARRMGDVSSGASETVDLWSATGSNLLALVASYWTLAVESFIAFLFLAYRTPWARRLRNGVLIHFLVLTYPIATVIGFGWLLAIMGYVQCLSFEGKSRATFIVTFAAMQMFLIPWSTLLS